jgi:peptide/nickel transport system substrate-binding protein
MVNIMQNNRTMYISPFVCAVTALAVIMGMFFSTSCSRQGSKEQSQGPAAELRYGFTTEPATFDPLSPANTADGRGILFNVFEGLVKPDTEGRLLPCLAHSVSIEPVAGEPGRLYIFKLRENVRFHDGSPLTAADVKFTLETAAAAGFVGFSAIEKIEIAGNYTILITLKQSDPEFLPYLTIGVVKAGSTDRDKNAIGTGPYYIESYNIQQSLTLKKFADYWQSGLPHLDKITIVFFADSDALILGLHGGSIDGASLTGALTQQLNPHEFDIVHANSAMVQMLALNNAAAPLDVTLVRQAINYSIDIQAIIDTAFYGKGKPSGSPIIPGLSVYYEQSLADPYPLDREKARAFLAKAGYGGEREPKLSLEITVPSNYTMHVDTAQVIADQLAKTGIIDVTIKLVDWATWLSDVYQKRNYQATVISVDSLYVSPKGFLFRYYSSENSNFFNFANADFDRIYNMILAETDEEKRIALYKGAQQIITGNAANVFIQDIVEFKVFRAGVYGGVLNYPLVVHDFASMYGK